MPGIDILWKFILFRDRPRLAELSRYGQFASHLSTASFAIIITIPDTYVQDKFDAGLAAHLLGVGSCPITLHNEEGAKVFLNIPNDRRMVVCIAFGYSAEGKPRGRVIRKEMREILHLEQYGRRYCG